MLRDSKKATNNNKKYVKLHKLKFLKHYGKIMSDNTKTTIQTPNIKTLDSIGSDRGELKNSKSNILRHPDLERSEKEGSHTKILPDSKNMESKKDSNDNPDSRISSSEKEELLNFTYTKDGLAKFHLAMAFCVMALILSMLIPKIFIANRIYYTSRDIARLNAEKELLDEEKIRLMREIEDIKNKHFLLELGER